MIVLLSKDKGTQMKFVQMCKEKNFCFEIVERASDFIINFQKIKYATIIVDAESIEWVNVVRDIIKTGTYLQDVIIIGDVCDCFGTRADSIEGAVSMARYKDGNNNKFYTLNDDRLEQIVRGVLDCYGFQNKYDGYEYLMLFCIVTVKNKYSRFSFDRVITDLSRWPNIKSDAAIKRNARYAIQQNTNEDIVRVRGGAKAVSLKAVVYFLVLRVQEYLNNHL